MLIGAHVSTAGGLPKAAERGLQRGCEAIQIFNQSPRMWRPTVYDEQTIADFKQAIDGSEVQAVMIHAVYLLNCASEDAEIRKKSLVSLTQSLRTGAAIGACGVVLHPGSAKAGDVKAAIKRAGETIKAALGDSEGCELHLENTAGAGGTLGRSFEELASLIDAAGGTQRLGVCLDSCHLFASGYDIRGEQEMAAVAKQAYAALGKDRVRSLHLNDSQTPLGSNKDRHANVGEGELGDRGCAAFLGERSFDGLPCVLETPGESRSGPSAQEVERTIALRKQALRARKRKA